MIRVIMTGWGPSDFFSALRRVERLYFDSPVFVCFDGAYFRIVVFRRGSMWKKVFEGRGDEAVFQQAVARFARVYSADRVKAEYDGDRFLIFVWFGSSPALPFDPDEWD